MKLFKKTFAPLMLLILLATSLFFIACDREPFLYPYVSEFISNVYYGEADGVKIKASYGFRERLRENDGKVSLKANFINFILLEKETEDVNYSVSFEIGENKYSQDFSLSPTSNRFVASIEIEEIEFSTLPIEISFGSKKVALSLTSLLPEQYIDGKTALKILEQKQGELIDSYKDQNEEFFAEVTLRVLIKDNKPYWHVAFIKGKRSVKALLIDGLSGEILAVRNIY